MARVEKTIFISYRRKDISWALAVYQDLTHQGYDVFFDYTSLPSGDFEQIIISNIKARAHFVLILTPTTLDRCSEPGDWLRREIETAIDEKRNIIPLFFNGFSFGSDKVSVNLTGKLKKVSQYNGMNVHQDYFSEAMTRLRTKFLSIPLNAVLHPVSDEVQEVVLEEQHAANEAAKKLNARAKREAAEARKKKQKEFIDGILNVISLNIRRFSIGGIILIGILVILFAGNYFLNNFQVNEMPEVSPSNTLRPLVITVTSKPITATIEPLYTTQNSNSNDTVTTTAHAPSIFLGKWTLFVSKACDSTIDLNIYTYEVKADNTFTSGSITGTWSIVDNQITFARNASYTSESTGFVQVVEKYIGILDGVKIKQGFVDYEYYLPSITNYACWNGIFNN